jgi:class 3 adenylate cyclase
VVAQHDGFVNQFYGDGAMAIFGFPTPREDDVRRAAEAALELHRVVRNLSFDSLIPRFSARLHTGIHSGLVLVHEGARRERGSKRETAHGDQVRRG